MKKLKLRKKIRSKISGTATRPRLNIFKSNKYVYAQIIDDEKGHTLIGISQKSIKDKGNKTQKAVILGEQLAEKALEKKIKKVVFDRGIYRYHGRIKALADAARKKGLIF
ncbi:50S ribosomal protein L18 [Candidatus Woesebacteria bacterium]|nr:50S ribosomal protein L18 [Candidatus Woesebacteria bacterium]QQG47797.1 MAG: 50S ribosomal protein L18 [Candidatus Woesebacteria bacterium]